MAGNVNTNEFLSALDELAKSRKIDREVLLSAIETAMTSAYKKSTRNPSARAIIDTETGKIDVFVQKKVVEEVEDSQTEMTREDAAKVGPAYELGDLVEISINPGDLGRIAAQTAKQVVVQHIREAERGGIYDEYSQKENEILTAIVQRIENRQVFVQLGRTEGLLDIPQQMPGEQLHINDRIKVYVLGVVRMGRGPQVTVSRTHPGLVKRLFELEVPEIVNGTVQIKSIAREAGYRTKMAVFSTDPMIDAVGSCVGPHGMRVENVVNELRTEKIDIIKWSQDPAEMIANALNPARVTNVRIVSEKEKSAQVIVPDNQLSLAIGKEGQNARLAAKLTGWKIDIKSQSQMAEIEAAAAEDAAPAEDIAIDDIPEIGEEI